MGRRYYKKMKRINYRTVFMLAVLVIAAYYIFQIFNSKAEQSRVVSTFEECVKAGYPVMESYPRLCRDSEGKLFTEAVSPTPQKNEQVRLFSPAVNQIIKSPLNIKGEARGSWFFEGSFSIFIKDEDGRELGRGIATAQGEWMTESFVPFEAEIVFETEKLKSGVIVLEKDNPSGLAENADEVRVPVLFGSADKRSVKLFYYNRKADPDISCSSDAVQSVEREIDLTKSPIRDTMELLISGKITSAEKEAGFVTEFPIEGLSLKGVNLKEGVLSVEFADTLNKTGGGSCKVNLLRAQIEKTAKQFEEVKEVRILPDEAFQP